MSDLVTGRAPASAHDSRAQNVSSRQPAASTTAGGGGRQMMTPTQIMEKRRERDAKRAEAEAMRRRQETEGLEGTTVVGVGGRQPGSGLENQQTVTAARSGSGSKRRETIPATTNGPATRPGPSMADPGQPRPEVPQSYQLDTTQIDRNRSEAFRKLNQPANPSSQQPQPQPQPQRRAAPQEPQEPQPSTRPAFPHAFERWETLSSHWEGLTGFWIRKLESNKNELNGKPIDQQMARQITDLSAAGANLFHAVVELQRLRASSERKFQRWFFETRNEQEQTSEKIAELTRQLQHERQNGNTSSASFEALKAEKLKAEELVKEMRRELQISKEEARRAWEELGRREQEERDRTMALRAGEPTSIGGVQVVPMAGLPARYMSNVQRPQTRDGPVPGGPGPTTMSGQPAPQEAFSRSQTTLESPDLEQAQFTYRPGGTSPTSTDPFTETARAVDSHQLRHEPDTQFYDQQNRSQPSSSAAAMAAARNVISPSHSATGNQGRFYEQPGISTAIHQPLSAVATTQPQPRSGTAHTDRSEGRSYILSVSGNGSEEEYHINPDGQFTLDSRGRRIPYSQPIGGSEELSEDDDDDYSAEVEHERMFAEQYAQRQQAVPPTSSGSLPTAGQAATRTQYASPQQVQTYSQPEISPVSPQSRTSTVSASSQPQAGPDYDGSGYGSQQQPSGWEGITAQRHRHPTRLSDILEEQSGRTSPSRTSYISGDMPLTGPGNGIPSRR